MLLKLVFAVTIPNVSGRRTRAARYPAAFEVAALDSPLRLADVGSPARPSFQTQELTERRCPPGSPRISLSA